MKSESERLEEVNTRLQSEITQLKQKLLISERNSSSLNESNAVRITPEKALIQANRNARKFLSQTHQTYKQCLNVTIFF